MVAVVTVGGNQASSKADFMSKNVHKESDKFLIFVVFNQFEKR